MTQSSTELKTKQELVEKYNSTTPRFNTTWGEFMRLGVRVLGADEYHLGPQGEIRWNSSNNIVPGDILEMAVVDGTIDIAVRNRTEEVREVENAKFFAQYRAQREKYGYSEEEKMEMRAEFGDEEVVDVFTGKAIAL